MKTCLLCGAESPNDQATCPNDGEASWSKPAVEEVKPDPKPRTSRSKR